MKKKLAAAAAVMTALFSMTGCATTADGAATGANGATSLIMIVGYMVIIIGVMYFVAIRPQKKEQQRRQRMLDSLKKGDKIITMGGMYGTLTNVGPVKVMVKLTEGVEIEFARTAISAFQDPDKMERAEKGEL